ncbi:MAG: GH36-type glycosyl hydrolase domain-containing protein [Steroidobacteraceae bacterium]
MAEAPADHLHLQSRSGLRVQINANGSVRRFDCDTSAPQGQTICLPLFVGNELDGGPTNLYLRRHSSPIEWTALLGPLSPTSFHTDPVSGMLVGFGTWLGINYCIALVLAHGSPAWFWHVRLENTTATSAELDLTYAQDVALAPYGALRLNEFYVSQYVDHTPLQLPGHGIVIGSRQNQPVDGRHPWCLIGSLREATAFGTDALQFHGLATRTGEPPIGIVGDPPAMRLQHEHSMVVIRDSRIQLGARTSATAGFFGSYLADHADATSATDVQRATRTLELPEAAPPSIYSTEESAPLGANLFSSAPLLDSLDLSLEALHALFGSQWRHEESGERGERLAFFHGKDSHVVLRAKELQVLRPHGQVLRTGRNMTPDETALTSTAWMSGVFHSMVTQGHVSINRFLSTVHSYLSLFRSHGQRVFMQDGDTWHLLNVPSAFEMSPNRCRWIYRHGKGAVHVVAEAKTDPHELLLSIEVTAGGPARFLISNHVSLNDDDGSAPGVACWARHGNDIVVSPAPDTDLGRRFPQGNFRITAAAGTQIENVGGDELLFLDGRSRHQPFVCILTAPTSRAAVSIRGNLIDTSIPAPLLAQSPESLTPRLAMRTAVANSHSEQLERLADIMPWFAQNALVHYLAPRGLEQFSGGGWGTRDVCQGPVELLFALGRVEPIRDLLVRVLGAQNPDGDWPQWFMFFERERGIRAGDSHGDIVFWPLVVLAQYLTASGDASLLDEVVPFFDNRGIDVAERATVWEHVKRALSLIEKRVIPGTALAAYGHGDWNDSLQPADPAMRERMCSAWTVTLHFQALVSLASALRSVGRREEADAFEKSAEAVQRDFQRLLVVDGVLTGYALFDDGKEPRYLLHPRDETTGIHFSSLAMIHAILEDMLTPAQAREHLKLIDEHLSAPDGVRLFDRPMPYHGGPQRLFQRAETATFFGREIGLMYMHAHLRYAQALAHVGQAERFFHALCQANPIGIRSIVPSATARQANCYYSSSDAAFADRYRASEEYERIRRNAVALDGGWRVYSSGAGIALGLIVRHFLGVSPEARALRVDPVIPAALDGLSVAATLLEGPVELRYRIKGSGSGVNRVTLNGTVLPFDREPNPHRRGAALIPRATVLQLLRASDNVLEIDIG